MVRKIFHDLDKVGQQSAVNARHEFLVQGEDIPSCSKRIHTFLDGYQLVRYGTVEIEEATSLAGNSPGFPGRLEDAISENRRRIRDFLQELHKEGVETLLQLETLPQGYQSKTLHTVTHLLDGFFGIDSFFYNLVEGSHGISDELRKKIAAEPAAYMLIAIKAST